MPKSQKKLQAAAARKHFTSPKKPKWDSNKRCMNWTEQKQKVTTFKLQEPDDRRAAGDLVHIHFCTTGRPAVRWGINVHVGPQTGILLVRGSVNSKNKIQTVFLYFTSTFCLTFFVLRLKSAQGKRFSASSIQDF